MLDAIIQNTGITLIWTTTKNINRTWILPHLTQSRNVRPSRVDPVELIEALLYKLKTGRQQQPRQ